MYKFFLIIFIVMWIFCGCSTAERGNPATPDVKFPGVDSAIDNPALVGDIGGTDRVMLGSWEMHFNPETVTLTVEANREAESHWSVRSYLPAPVFSVISFDPISGILEVDAKITNTNPFNIAAYDVRMIVYTDNVGCRLMNPDNWTGLFDKPIGSVINPFKAYAKSVPGRKFEANGKTHTERLQLYFPAGITMLDFAIDASFPSNANEPYMIKNFRQGELCWVAGSQAIVQVDVYDWQDNVSSVSLYCPSITGATFIPMNRTDYKSWNTVLTNATGASAGRYVAVIMASSSDSGSLSLYDVVQIEVAESCPDGCGYSWTKNWGGSDDDSGKCIAVDNSGNIYVAGLFRGTVDFDPGTGVDEVSGNNDWDVYLSRFAPDGTYEWVRTWCGSLIDDVSKVVTDSYGNIYVFGYFSFEMDFDPGPGVDMHYVNELYGQDPFLLKLDPDGNYVWGLSWGGSKLEFSYGCGVYEDSYLIVTGSFWINADFYPGRMVDLRDSNGSRDAYLMRFVP